MAGMHPAESCSYPQQILIIGIVATAAITVYVAAQPIMARLQTPKEAPSESATDRLASTPSPAERETPVAPEPNTTSAKAEPGSVPAVEALSLGVADKLYLAGDSENALVTYDRLLRRLPPSEEHQAMRDFLTFRMAMCYRNAGNNAQADAAFPHASR